MAPKSDTDLKDLKDLILGLYKKLSDQYNLINKKLDVYIVKTDGKLTSLEKQVTDTRTSLEQRIDEKVTTLEKQVTDTRTSIEKRIDDISKRIDSTNKRGEDISSRLNIMTIGFLSIVGILVRGLLTSVARLVSFSNP